MSYSTFAIRWTATTAAVEGSTHSTAQTDALEYSVEVRNTGTLAGAKAVHAFISRLGDSSDQQPLLSLWGLKKVYLAPGEITTLRFATAEHDWCPFCSVDAEGLRAVQPGAFRVRIGGSGSVNGGSGCAGGGEACASMDVQLVGELVHRPL